MQRLIDANALIEKAYWHGEHPSVDDLFAEGVDAVDVSDIDNAPTIEAEPVRHGRWLCVVTEEEQFFLCNRCKKKEYLESNYCPNCGARMLEDE